MPLRAYQPIKPPCRLCGDGFELMQQAADPPLTTCPKCGQDVIMRPVNRVAAPKVTKPISTSEAKGAGFSVLKRTSDGTFEKQ